MEILFVIINILLFIPFLLGLGGIDILMSKVSSPDKILFIALLYIMMIMMFMRKQHISKKIVSQLWYIFPVVIYLSILVYHYVSSGQSSYEQLIISKKEIVRLLFFILILILSSALKMKFKHYQLLVRLLALFGIPLGLMTVYSSITGISSRKDMIIGEFVRAGGDLTSTNNLAAVLNITTLCALGAFLSSKKRWQKTLWLVAAIFGQGGRLLTWSNGSVVGIIVSIFAAYLLLRKFDPAMCSRLLRLIVVFIVVLSTLTVLTGKADLYLSRIMETDESGSLVSVSSRKYQYDGLWDMFQNQPEKLVFGVGTANVHSALGTTQTLHNSYLLPLVTAGLFGFFSFNLLWLVSLRNFYNAVKLSVGNKEHMILTVIILSSFLGYSIQILTVPYTLSSSTWFFIILSFSFKNYAQENILGQNRDHRSAHMARAYGTVHQNS